MDESLLGSANPALPAPNQLQTIVLTVQGNGFLYNMVRMLTGALVDVGMGKMKPERIPEILAARDRIYSVNTAPAKGLTLKEIEFTDWE